MERETRHELSRIKGFIEEKAATLNEYFAGRDSMDPGRFWSLFRSDLMRRRPSEVGGYLNNNSRKLYEIQGFGEGLADTFFASNDNSVLRRRQQALIFACLEMEAAVKIRELYQRALHQSDKNRALTLSQKLNLWRAL